MFSLYRRLIRLRAASPALHRGDYVSLTGVPEGVFAYLRTLEHEQVVVALNLTGEPVEANITPEPAGGALLLSTDHGRHVGQVPLHPLRLGADEGVIVRLRG
jgi:glycosidase